MITLQWQKCIKTAVWCQFNTQLLKDRRFQTYLGERKLGIRGVYIIWTGIGNLTVLKVGYGVIKDQFAAHLQDPEIHAHKPTRLYATWAPILSVNQEAEAHPDVEAGIVKFLGIVFKPTLIDKLPEVDPVIVNLPSWRKPVPPL